MNEIIDNLKNQALEWAMETLDPKQVNEYEWAVAIDKKFTELIVRECADTVTDRCEMRNESDAKRAEYYARRIKEHFGVEE